MFLEIHELFCSSPRPWSIQVEGGSRMWLAVLHCSGSGPWDWFSLSNCSVPPLFKSQVANKSKWVVHWYVFEMKQVITGWCCSQWLETQMTCCYVQLFSIAAHIYGHVYLLEGWRCSAGCRLMGLLMKASSAASQHTNTNRILTKYDKCVLELWMRCFRGSSISHIFRCKPGTGLSRFVVI